MVYVTGDIHAQIDIRKLSVDNLKKQKINIKEGDFLIILGDFGLPFFDKDVEEKRNEYKYWMKWLSQKPYTILWIDGNHENFNFWDKQAVTEWNGGKVQVHPEADNVIHLMRGEVFEIEGRKYFAFGGAQSHDKEHRVENVSWWSREIASAEEMQNAINNLEKHNFEVDYILSHTPPSSFIEDLPSDYCVKDATAEFLSKLVNNVSYNVWMSGHLHMDAIFKSDKIALFYDKIDNIDNIERAIVFTPNLKKDVDVSNYKYTLNFNPKMWLPEEIKTID